MKKNFISKIVLVGVGCAMTCFAVNAQDNLPSPNQTVPVISATAPLPGATFVDDGTQKNPNPLQVENPVVPSQDDATTVAPLSQNAPTPTHAVSQQQTAPANALGNTEMGRAAFSEMVRNLIPLDPQQIMTLRDMFDQSQQAVAQYPGVPPKPTSSSIMVNMSPGAVPPVIRLRAGYVTSMVFLDSTGQPWPVTGYDLGNPKAFNIQPSAPDGKSNTLIVQALVRYEQGNLAVMLKGMNTPVMITLMPGQRAVDYRVDLRMPGLGPDAAAVSVGLPQGADPILMSFLDGVTPSGAQPVAIEGAPAQAWVLQNRLYLRTRVTVLSPGWIESMNSPDGTHVYELPKTPVILASHRGQMVQLSVRGL